jgi:hydroxypyruvate reductase
VNSLAQQSNLHQAAREIFDSALRSVDAYDSIKRSVSLVNTLLSLADFQIDLAAYKSGVHAIATGKAALPMAVALEDTLGKFLKRGLIAGPVAGQPLGQRLTLPPGKMKTVWRCCEGGHPLPNNASLAAAKESFDLLENANDANALIIFLISGGGSAMIEWPRHERITLADLRLANRQLVSSGASIAEINSVRRAFSAVKGGKLSARAPLADQITLIISDTNPGDEATVASGPTLPPPAGSPNAKAVLERYGLHSSLPESVLVAILEAESDEDYTVPKGNKHYVLLDNQSAIKTAAEKAQRLGYQVEVSYDISEQPIEEGSPLLVSRVHSLLEQAEGDKRVCLISGGEFSCPVAGSGSGGRNLETVLRCAIEFDRRHHAEDFPSLRLVALSAGTDGIDGNSPAAGAMADESTIARALAHGLNAESFLENSDSFSFFDTLGDAIIIGPTGTNVRDIRILMASA